jgi:hypothetical protein
MLANAYPTLPRQPRRLAYRQRITGYQQAHAETLPTDGLTRGAISVGAGRELATIYQHYYLVAKYLGRLARPKQDAGFLAEAQA